MITYEFQILRYRPDHVSEEFVNIGLVFFEPSTRTLRAEMVNSIARITCFFPAADGRQLSRRLRHLAIMFNAAADEQDEMYAAQNLENITSHYLTPDDNALYFTSTQRGMDEEPEMAFWELYDRLIIKHVGSTEEVSTDKEVWTKVFKPFFQDLGITRRLEKHQVITPNDKLEFAHSWKNEIWHCYEPITFNLKKTDSVKNKVYKWVGKLRELATADEAIEIKLLTLMPNDPELLAFILDRLDDQNFGASRVSVIQESEAEQLALEIQAEIGAHDLDEI